jgi:hypothetical protein
MMSDCSSQAHLFALSAVNTPTRDLDSSKVRRKNPEHRLAPLLCDAPRNWSHFGLGSPKSGIDGGLNEIGFRTATCVPTFASVELMFGGGDSGPFTDRATDAARM